MSHYYNLQDLMEAVRQDHPEWSEEQVEAEALRLRRELQCLDIAEYRNDLRFYTHFLPLEEPDDGSQDWV